MFVPSSSHFCLRLLRVRDAGFVFRNDLRNADSGRRAFAQQGFGLVGEGVQIRVLGHAPRLRLCFQSGQTAFQFRPQFDGGEIGIAGGAFGLDILSRRLQPAIQTHAGGFSTFPVAGPFPACRARPPTPSAIPVSGALSGRSGRRSAVGTRSERPRTAGAECGVAQAAFWPVSTRSASDRAAASLPAGGRAFGPEAALCPGRNRPPRPMGRFPRGRAACRVFAGGWSRRARRFRPVRPPAAAILRPASRSRQARVPDAPTPHLPP